MSRTRSHTLLVPALSGIEPRLRLSLIMKPMYAFSVRVAVDLKLFELIDASKPCVDAADLAVATGASQDLISMFR